MKRYRPTEEGMAVSETGMWVRHTDVAELQHQLLDVRTLCASALGAAAELQRQLAAMTQLAEYRD